MCEVVLLEFSELLHGGVMSASLCIDAVGVSSRQNCTVDPTFLRTCPPVVFTMPHGGWRLKILVLLDDSLSVDWQLQSECSYGMLFIMLFVVCCLSCPIFHVLFIVSHFIVCSLRCTVYVLLVYCSRCIVHGGPSIACSLWWAVDGMLFAVCCFWWAVHGALSMSAYASRTVYGMLLIVYCVQWAGCRVFFFLVCYLAQENWNVCERSCAHICALWKFSFHRVCRKLVIRAGSV